MSLHLDRASAEWADECINFMADDDQGRIRENYWQNYDRLAEMKRMYDPGNVFHLNQNIVPWYAAAAGPVSRPRGRCCRASAGRGRCRLRW